MITKKILAGVLSAASIMAMTVSASALEAPDKTKAVTKPGEAEYEVGIGVMSAELDVELPGSMKAFLNPYGAEVAVDEETTPNTTTNTVVSWAYEVVNNTTDFGILIDIKDAKATVSKTSGAAVLADDPKTAAEANDKKTVGLAFVAAATSEELSNIDGAAIVAGDKSAITETDQGMYIFNTTDSADKDGGKQSKVAYAPAKTDADGAGKVYLGITGAVATADTNGDAFDYTEDDAVTLTYKLKINPAAKTQALAVSGATTPATAAWSAGDASGTGLTKVSATEYNLAVSTTGSAVAINYNLASGYSIGAQADVGKPTSGDTDVATVNASSGAITPGGTAGSTDVTVKIKKDSDSSLAATIIIHVTAS